MLTWGDDVEVHALRKRGWSISAIARHTGFDLDSRTGTFGVHVRKPGQSPYEVRSPQGSRHPAARPVQHGPTTSLYHRDPDGNMVELQIDNMAPDDATAYMRGEEDSVDPIGPSFDPDTMLAALRLAHPNLS